MHYDTSETATETESETERETVVVVFPNERLANCRVMYSAHLAT